MHGLTPLGTSHRKCLQICRALCVVWRTVTPQRGTWQTAVLSGICQEQQPLLAGIPACVLTRGIYAACHHCQLLAVLPLEVHRKFARASARGHDIVCTSHATPLQHGASSARLQVPFLVRQLYMQLSELHLELLNLRGGVFICN